MLLVIDIGNSFTKGAMFLDGQAKAFFSIPSAVPHDPDALGSTIAGKLGLEPDGKTEIREIALCSVVPQLTPLYYETAFDFFGIEPWQLDYTADIGMKNLYLKPDRTGPDRLANALAAKTNYGAPVVVVDMGTATKFDVVNGDGDFAGGAIAPGIMSAAQEMFRKAARLYPVELKKPDKIIAIDTAPAMQSGIFWGAVGAIDFIIDGIAAELGLEKIKAVGTGGLAALFRESSKRISAYDEHLTLKGIYLAFKHNN